jgi:hypothetical protein
MSREESFSKSSCEDEIRTAGTELSAFIAAVTDLFGPEEARLSAEDWLEESEVIDIPHRSTNLEWRAVTVAAAVRLAGRLAASRREQKIASSETKVLPIPSSNCLSSVILV